MERVDIEAVSAPSVVYIAGGEKIIKSISLILSLPSWINNFPLPLILTNLKCLQQLKQNGKATRMIQEKGKGHL